MTSPVFLIPESSWESASLPPCPQKVSLLITGSPESTEWPNIADLMQDPGKGKLQVCLYWQEWCPSALRSRSIKALHHPLAHTSATMNPLLILACIGAAGESQAWLQAPLALSCQRSMLHRSCCLSSPTCAWRGYLPALRQTSSTSSISVEPKYLPEPLAAAVVNNSSKVSLEFLKLIQSFNTDVLDPVRYQASCWASEI